MVVVNPAGAGQRLETLIDQAFAQADGRGAVSGLGAGLASWRHTSRGKTDAAIQAVAKATAIAVLAATGVAVSVATLGALPLAAAAAALAAFGSSKLYNLVKHARDVRAVLDLMTSMQSADTGLEIKWSEKRPTTLDADTIELGERIFMKCVNDFKKLDSELDAIRARWGRERTRLLGLVDKEEKPADSSNQYLIGVLLAHESRIQRSGTALAGGGRMGSHGAGSSDGMKLHPLGKPSGDIKDPVEKALHRVRRIRFYLRWLDSYLDLVEEVASDAVTHAAAAERTLVAAAAIQVTMSGNHDGCGTICFGPGPADVLETNPRETAARVALDLAKPGAPSPNAHLAAASGFLGAGPGLGDTARNAGGQAAWVSGARTLTAGVEKTAVEEASKAAIAVAGKTAGAAFGAGFASVLGDAIEFAAKEVWTRREVVGPLQERVHAVRRALRNASDNGLDEAIRKGASENDPGAITQAFLAAHAHYPKRIHERLEILRAHVTELGSRPSRDSPYNRCEEAAVSFRYLAKVLKYSEKLRVHALFVRHALAGIEYRIFTEGYRMVLQPREENADGSFSIKQQADGLNDQSLAAVRDRLRKTTTHQRDFIGEERHASQELKRLAAAEEASRRALFGEQAGMFRDMAAEFGAAVAGDRHDRYLADAVKLGKSTIQRTCLNALPFNGGRHWHAVQPAQVGARALTMEEWRSASSVLLKRRSGLTAELDTALESYLRRLPQWFAEAASLQALPTSEATAMKISQHLFPRLRGAEALMEQVRRWLRAKEPNEASSRRPAIQQLSAMVQAEIDLVQNASTMCGQAAR